MEQRRNKRTVKCAKTISIELIFDYVIFTLDFESIYLVAQLIQTDVNLLQPSLNSPPPPSTKWPMTVIIFNTFHWISTLLSTQRSFHYPQNVHKSTNLFSVNILLRKTPITHLFMQCARAIELFSGANKMALLMTNSNHLVTFQNGMRT